jgi:predicted permease
MLSLFADNLLPVLLAAGAGYFLAGKRRVDPRSLSHVGFYVLAPCLVFRLLVENQINLADAARMGLFTVVVVGICGAAAFAAGKAFRWSRTQTAAVTLAVLLPNAGNFGLPATLFAFGEDGLAQASVFFVIASLVTYTGGVLVASLGRASAGRSFLELVKVPSLWAMAAGVLVVATDRDLPFAAERTVNLLADACIPVFLLILGMQLRNTVWKGVWAPLATVAVLRLGLGAVVGILAAKTLGLTGTAFQAGVLESAMPSAVISIILATEYDCDPGFVTSAVLVTTLLCPLTLTPLLMWLGV